MGCRLEGVVAVEELLSFSDSRAGRSAVGLLVAPSCRAPDKGGAQLYPVPPHHARSSPSRIRSQMRIQARIHLPTRPLQVVGIRTITHTHARCSFTYSTDAHAKACSCAHTYLPPAVPPRVGEIRRKQHSRRQRTHNHPQPCSQTPLAPIHPYFSPSRIKCDHLPGRRPAFAIASSRLRR